VNAATRDNLLAGILTGGALLILVLVIWLMLHHAKPGMRIDIGVRGWVSLKPGESVTTTPDKDEGHEDGADGKGDDDPSSVTS
jgi:hypothetical protein